VDLALMFANRTAASAAVHGPRVRNPAFAWIVGTAILALGVVLAVPFLRDVFLLARPNAVDLAVCATAGTFVIAWLTLLSRLDATLANPRISSQLAPVQTVLRAFKVVAGFTLLGVGVAMLVLPGPGWLTIALGLALLAGEFAWAEVLLARLKDTGGKGADMSRSLIERARRALTRAAQRRDRLEIAAVERLLTAARGPSASRKTRTRRPTPKAGRSRR
ncbi:MAG: PGPGW domain-containing protein, partial [Vicinamibacterales bacterium]